MGHITNSNLRPFTIGCYVGDGDPQSFDEFLAPFCKEIVELSSTGIIEGAPFIEFKVRLFTADTAARSKPTATRSNSHKSGCHKCDQHSQRRRFNFFQETVGNLRTKESFNDRLDMPHHKSDQFSALENLGLGMVTQFPLDAMHMIDLGVAKFIMKAFVNIY